MRKPSLIILVFVAVLFGQIVVLAQENRIPRIELIGDSIYIDGKKFFIKGIGYSPYRPGDWPGSKVPLEIVEADFKRIKEAGFNTLRVWDTMLEEQLKLAEKYGLKVMQAVGLKPDADFGYSGFIRLAESKVRQMCRRSKNHPNVIMYLLMNEPHADAVLKSGIDKTLNLYKRLIDIIRKEDPNRPISMTNAYWTLWLDQSIWDVVSFNSYSYCDFARDIGYANFVKNLKSIHSEGRPFLVTEFGLSVSPEGSGKGSYGGNTEEEQAEGLVTYFRELIDGGAAGGCVFEWNDEWWKAGNPAVHDADAEEWFGIIGIEKKGNPIGTPRKAYYDLKEELKLVVTKPTEGHRVLDNIDIEINTSPGIFKVQYRIDGGEWIYLFKREDWWRETIDASSMQTGLHLLTIKGLDGEREIIRKVNIIKCKDRKDLLSPIHIELTTDKESYKNGDIIELKAHLTDKEGAPLKNHDIKLGMLNSINSYSRRWAGRTDDKGFFSKTIPVIGRGNEWYYIFWAGAEIEDYSYKTRTGEISYVKTLIGEGFPIKWLVAKEAKDIIIDGVIEDAWLKADKIEISPDMNFAEGDVKDSGDLSAEVRILWDEDNIYLLASVKDDVPMKNKYEKLELWKGDCRELFVSVDPTKIPEKGYSSFDFQILIGTNGKMWIPGQRKGGIRNNIPVLSRAVAKRSNDGYVLEAKVNIANFWDKPLNVFSKGNILGFDIAIGDADESGMRDSKLVWNGTAENYKDSAIWGRLKLE